MKTALVFPGQGSQFKGMGKDIYDSSPEGKDFFTRANEILGFDIAYLMFEGTEEDLQKTSVTQPAIFIHSVALATISGLNAKADMTAGHSLGEFSALVSAGVLSFEDGLKLVSIRANAMQKACNLRPSTMAAIVGLADNLVEEACAETGGIVVAANYNSPGQLAISGTVEDVEKAIEIAKSKGAKIAKMLKVDGAFHSPLMEPARVELEEGIMKMNFSEPRIPVYQNVSAKAETSSAIIRENLVKQLTSPVRWTQSVEAMIADGCGSFIEVGPGKVLQGLIKRINGTVEISGKQNI